MLKIPFRTGVNMREFAFYGAGIIPAPLDLQRRQLQALQALNVKLVRFYASTPRLDGAAAGRRVLDALNLLQEFDMQAVLCLDDAHNSDWRAPGNDGFHTEINGHYHKRYFLEDAYRGSYFQHVTGLLNAANGGVAVKNHPALLVIELGNEYALHPRPGNVPGAPEPSREDSQAFLLFVRSSSELIKGIAPNKLVSTGLVNTNHVCSPFEDRAEFAREIYKSPAVDVVSLHYYFHDGERNQVGVDLEVAKSLDMPFYIGEFGAKPNEPPGGRAEFYRRELQDWEERGAFTAMVWAFDTSPADAGVSDEYSFSQIKPDFQDLKNVLGMFGRTVTAVVINAGMLTKASDETVTPIPVVGLVIATAPARPTTTSIPPFAIQFPIKWDYNITGRFDDAVTYGNKKREGMRFVPKNANQPLPVLAAQRGEVTKIENFPPGYGNYVVISHKWYEADEYETLYAHLATVSVKVGDYVNAGDPIGTAGDSGSADIPLLFFVLKHIGKGKQGYVEPDVINPEPLLVKTLPARDQAIWVEDINVEDGTVMVPGEVFIKKWRVRNTGNTTWTSDYRLVFFSDTLMGTGAPEAIPVTKPGEFAVVSVPMTAPMVQGKHRSTWILQDGQGKAFLHSLYTLIDVIPKAERSTVNRAAYVEDVTIQDGTPVIAGTSFRKTWKVRNTGGTTWESGYTLAYFKDNKMGGPDQVNVSPLNPNQTGDISVDLVAPTTSGVHFSYWMLRDPSGASFGPELYAKINVVQVRQGGGTSTLRFPSPVQGNYYINWRFWVPINYGDGFHKGVDYVSNEGSGLPIFAAADGIVVMARQCQNCTAAQPSFRLNNLDIPTATAQGAFKNINPWNYGFGHIVVVRYSYDVLPALAKQAFDGARRTGWYAYVIYAHLQEFFVTKGQQVTAGMQIARLGDSGNSTAPHLHLEVVPKRESTHELPRGTRGQKNTWLDPELMFDL